MSSYRLTARADSELLDIYLYGLEQFGFRQAERYKLSLDECFSMLADHPRMGRTSPSVRPGIRRHEHGSHVVLYQEERDYVLIVAVLHSRNLHGLKL